MFRNLVFLYFIWCNSSRPTFWPCGIWGQIVDIWSGASAAEKCAQEDWQESPKCPWIATASFHCSGSSPCQTRYLLLLIYLLIYIYICVNKAYRIIYIHTLYIAVKISTNEPNQIRVFMTSTEADVCLHMNGGCSQICENKLGFVHCSCLPGNSLAVDGKSCLPDSKGAEPTQLTSPTSKLGEENTTQTTPGFSTHKTKANFDINHEKSSFTDKMVSGKTFSTELNTILIQCRDFILLILCQTSMTVTHFAAMWMHNACWMVIVQAAHVWRGLQAMGCCA